jgi:hypothetical protein
LEGCVKGLDCKDGRGTFDIACPRKEFEDTSFSSTNMVNATFRFKDEDGFWKDLGETWGIDKTWVSFGRRRVQYSNGCQGQGTHVNECILGANDWWYDYPRASDNIEIYNPKKVIGDSYATASGTLDRLKIMRIAGIYDGKTPTLHKSCEKCADLSRALLEQTQMSDLVDASSIPAYSAVEAVESMEVRIICTNGM